MVDEFLYNAFAKGKIELKGQFTLGSNYTFLASIQFEEQEVQAVYKPQKGEQPLWDFPENTLSGREVAAYLVSQALGWELVPYTIFREDGPFGPGSLQQFIDYDPNYHYFSFKPEDKERLRPVALFDIFTNNADRKGSHVFIEKRSRHLYAIDHGLCFNVDNKLRTVIWDFAGEPIQPEHLSALKLISDPQPGLVDALLKYLSDDEVTMLALRAGDLLAAGVYPRAPRDRRAYPYPPL